MRKLALFTFLAVVLALPLQAARGKDQSYISYDDGGALVRQAEDGREIDARVNMPLFVGDELITNRRGRAEVRLADGNVVGLDRATAMKLRSVLNDYDTESADGTLVELSYGKLAIYRTGDTKESLRLDTQTASYYVNREAAFSVESDSRGPDRVAVFAGTVEVRTPARTVRLREGESARVDDRGPFEFVSDNTGGADDFERWFLKRVDRYTSRDSRYLDSSLGYYDADLSANGSWTFMTGYGWGWRPYVSTGWRPYYNGYWMHSNSGCLVWVSYEPWGWAPYHYGRWAYDAIYGWFWMPGAAYAPAWVYWWYGPDYIGWAPAGWWEGYRGYYDWAYRPYQRAGFDFGFGFYGRVRVNEVDLRPWTFIDSRTIISMRVDRAALSTDVVRGRLRREPGGFGLVSGAPARFGKNELKDPAKAVGTIYRRGVVGGGIGGSPITDVTPFIRRDADPTGAIRDVVARTRRVDGAASGGGAAASGLAPIGGGSIAPIGRTPVAPIGGGPVAPIGTGALAPITPDTGRINRGGSTPATPADSGTRNSGGGRISRGDTPRNEGGSTGSISRDTGSRTSGGGGQIDRGTAPRDSGGAVNRGEAQTPRNDRQLNNDTPRTDQPNWRDRFQPSTPREAAPATTAPAPPAPRDTNWRNRGGDQPAGGSQPAASSGERSRSVDRGGSDVPRRVIDGIGGARIYRGGDSGSSRGSSSGRSSGGSSASAPPPSSRGGGGGSVGHSAPSSPPPSSSGSSSGSRDSGGGKVERSKG